MIGTIINIIAVLIGSSIGLVLRTKLPKKIIKTVFQGIGLFTLFLGFVMAMKTGSYLILVFSLVIGAVIGETIDIEKFIDNKTNLLKNKIRFGGEKFSEGFLTAFLLYCIGSMTILGAFEEGMKADATLLITKSVMDGFSSIALASAFGIGVAFSVIPMLIFQGGLTLLAMYFGKFIDISLINELTAVGGILLIGLGINILEIKKIKVFNIFPALIIAIIIAWIKFEFKLDF